MVNILLTIKKSGEKNVQCSFTVVCCPFFRVETEIGKFFPFEVIVLLHESENFFHVYSFLFFPKQCQLDISIDFLASNRTTEGFEVFMGVFFEAVPCFWVTISIILEENIQD